MNEERQFPTIEDLYLGGITNIGIISRTEAAQIIWEDEINSLLMSAKEQEKEYWLEQTLDFINE